MLELSLTNPKFEPDVKNDLKNCQCHSGKSYKECCQKLHKGAPPSDALALMRSRYCAYALGLIDYIIFSEYGETSSQIPNQLRKQQIERTYAGIEFMGLDIHEFVPGDEVSTVTFRAVLAHNGLDLSFVEKSLFKRIHGFWKYVSRVD